MTAAGAVKKGAAVGKVKEGDGDQSKVKRGKRTLLFVALAVMAMVSLAVLLGFVLGDGAGFRSGSDGSISRSGQEVMNRDVVSSAIKSESEAVVVHEEVTLEDCLAAAEGEEEEETLQDEVHLLCREADLSDLGYFPRFSFPESDEAKVEERSCQEGDHKLS